MRKLNLAAMQSDELWLLYEELTKLLLDRVLADKRELENRLAKLNPLGTIREAGFTQFMTDRAPRREYPKVLPKYRNPLAPSETWSGRGKQPRWLVAALKTGHGLDEFKIGNVKNKPLKKGTARSRQT
jgi:DNA-binding protein H-NS